MSDNVTAPPCPVCKTNAAVVDGPDSWICKRCGAHFIPDNPVFHNGDELHMGPDRWAIVYVGQRRGSGLLRLTIDDRIRWIPIAEVEWKVRTGEWQHYPAQDMAEEEKDA